MVVMPLQPSPRKVSLGIHSPVVLSFSPSQYVSLCHPQDMMLIVQMFDTMTVRWGCFLFFGISAILAVVPFVAFFYGPIIRSHSKYSKQLMAEETRRIEAEKHGEEDPGDGAYEMEEGREGERLDERVAEDREKLQRGDAEPGAVGERTLST